MKEIVAYFAAVLFLGMLNIYAHEYAHVMVGRAFGVRPKVIRYGFVSWVEWYPGSLLALTPQRRVLMFMSGVIMNYCIAVMCLVVFASSPALAVGGAVLSILMGWGELLSVSPQQDGYQILRILFRYAPVPNKLQQACTGIIAVGLFFWVAPISAAIIPALVYLFFTVPHARAGKRARLAAKVQGYGFIVIATLTFITLYLGGSIVLFQTFQMVARWILVTV